MRTNTIEKPNKFRHNAIGNKVELFLYEKIEKVIKEDQVSYDSDLSYGVVENNRNAMIAGFVHLKYSADDELALTHKGIHDPNNAEYLAYREYVNEVKVYLG